MRICRAFSLLELVVVVVIVAAVVAIALPRFSMFKTNASAAAGASHLLRLAHAYQAYHAEFGVWPTDHTLVTMPEAMRGRLADRDFSEPPVGLAVRSTVRLTAPPDDVFLGRYVGIVIGGGGEVAKIVQRMDVILDDGDITTGQFIRHVSNSIESAGIYASLRISED